MSAIYKITNSIDDLIYVGKTTVSLVDRLKRHLKSVRSGSETRLHRHIRKYGKENYQIVLIEEVFDNIDEREIFHINLLKPELNMTDGGEGGSTTHGKKWITDGTCSKYISAGETVPEGWRIGRTCKFSDPVFQAEMSSRMGQIPSKESSQKSADSRRGKKRGPYKRISTE